MEHTSNIPEIPSSDDYRVIFLPSHTSSLLQPLDTPTWTRFLNADNESSEEDTSDSEADSTPSLPELASLAAHESSDSEADYPHSLPDLVTDESSDSEAESTSSLPDLESLPGDEPVEAETGIFPETGYFPATIGNLDEVRVDTYQTHQPRQTAAPRPRRSRITVFTSVSAYQGYVYRSKKGFMTLVLSSLCRF